MNFLLKSKPKSRYNSKIILSVLFFVVLILFTIFSPNLLRGGVNTLFRPLWVIKDKSIGTFFSFGDFFSFRNSLIKENNELKDELSNLRLTKIDYDNILKENEELKEQFGRETGSSKIIANILSKPPQSPFDTFILDAGSDTGVSVGDTVYVSDTLIIGLVADVSPKSSIVKLFSNGGYESEVVSSRTGSSFLIVGDGGSNFELVVPKETDILWGDTFLYPGARSSVLATVYFVDSNSQSSFKTIHLKFPSNIFQTKRVFILK